MVSPGVVAVSGTLGPRPRTGSAQAALDRIDALPVPRYADTPFNLPPAERQACLENDLRAYNRKRAVLAEQAIQSARPPRREDVAGLPPMAAEREHVQALKLHLEAIDRLREVAQQARARPTVAGPTEPAPAPDRLEEREIDHLLQRLEIQGGPAGARALADQLRGKAPPIPAQLIARLNERGGVRAVRDLLCGAAFDPQTAPEAPLSVADQTLIGAALGEAHQTGLLPGSFVEQLLCLEDPVAAAAGHEALAELIAASGCRGLIHRFVDRSLLFAGSAATPDEADRLLLGAARAMAADPDVLQENLHELQASGELAVLLERIAPHPRGSASDAGGALIDNALAALINGAAGIQPPTDAVAALFELAARHALDRPGVGDALANLFITGGNAAFLQQESSGTDPLVSEPTLAAFVHHFVGRPGGPQREGVLEAVCATPSSSTAASARAR